MKPGCVDAEDYADVKMEKSGGKWEIKAHTDRPFGYIQEFCISCTNGGSNSNYTAFEMPKYRNVDWPRQTITYDNFKVQLPSKCTYSMIERDNAPTDVVFNMDVLDTDDNNKNRDINVWTKIFKQDDATNCPILKCELLNKGCVDAYNGVSGSTTLLSLEGTTVADWTIKVADRVNAGFHTQACVKCFNEYQYIQYDRLHFEQTGRCLAPVNKDSSKGPTGEGGELIADVFEA